MTVDDLPVDDGDAPRGEIAAVYVVSHPGFDGNQDGRGSVFFATDRQPGDAPGEAIVNGYTVVSGESGLYSEHGPWYETDLRERAGRVLGYRPGSHTFSDAMALGERAHRDDDIEATWDSVAAACGAAD